MVNIPEIWSTYQKYSLYTRNMVKIPEVWSTYQHTRNIVNIPETWPTYQKYGLQRYEMHAFTKISQFDHFCLEYLISE